MASGKRTLVPRFLAGKLNRRHQAQLHLDLPSLVPDRPSPDPNDTKLSQWSTDVVPDSAWASSDFMVGVGMVIIQEKTEKVLLVYDTLENYWFFPRGRKDVGETFDEAAMREAYEESGYRVKQLPLLHEHNQPPAGIAFGSMVKPTPSTEAIFLSFRSYGEFNKFATRGEYLTMWYAGSVPEDAVREEDTGMENEKHYQSYLMSYEEAIQRVWGQEVPVLKYVWDCWLKTKEYRASLAQNVEEAAVHSQATAKTDKAEQSAPI